MDKMNREGELSELREQLQRSPRGLKNLDDTRLAKILQAKQKRNDKQAHRSFNSGRKSFLP
jgi:hypothetical protein